MTLVTLFVPFLILLGLAYWIYGRYLACELRLDNTRPTPAHLKRDEEDFLPTHPFYLFGQHFSAIAAAGPIAGPIAACLIWGWLPAFIWIAVGVVLIGAVHDFTSLVASVRHGASSIAEVTRREIDSIAGRSMSFFIWIALVYIIVAFADITASSFVTRPEELTGLDVSFNPGGAVALASVLYLGLSLILGLVQRWLVPPLWLVTVVFVPLTFAAVWAGTYFSHMFVLNLKTWALLICLYCFLASLCPVWLLLQPRGYLGGFVLYMAIGVGLVGVLFGGYEIVQPAFKGWNSGVELGQLFPFLFVTIACGACSGFHGLVCSGTTSKQIDRESHTHVVGYGAMLAEGLVAVLALGVIMVLPAHLIVGLPPGAIYGRGLGEFLTLLIGREHLEIAMTFGAMAFSTFVFDTLDVSTRLGRYLAQEFMGWTGRLASAVCTGLTLALPTWILLSAEEGSWARFWKLFGASNQLLAALTLLSITVWLYRSGRRIRFTLPPLLFVIVITMWALGELTWVSWWQAKGFDTNFLNSILSLSLMILALFVCLRAIVRVRSRT